MKLCPKQVDSERAVNDVLHCVQLVYACRKDVSNWCREENQ